MPHNLKLPHFLTRIVGRRHTSSNATLEAEVGKTPVPAHVDNSLYKTEELEPASGSAAKPDLAGADQTLKRLSHDVKDASFMVKKIDHFTEDSTVLIKILEGISEVHPFLKVAVVAFKAVINIELTRRENNQKVMALYVQMKDLFSALRSLRDIPGEDRKHGMTIEQRLDPVLKRITENIKNCGSVCDSYANERLIIQIIGSTIYEQRLSSFSAVFSQDHRALTTALQVHAMFDAARIQVQLDKTAEMMRDIFLLLDSPREREVRKYIKEHGGADECKKDDRALEDLVRMEPGAEMWDKATVRDDVTFLKGALAEDLEKILDKNLSQFTRKFAKAQEDVKAALETLAKELRKGPHEYIRDKDISAVWADMRWRNSVKSHRFTLSLRDHLIQKYISVRMSSQIHTVIIDNAAAWSRRFLDNNAIKRSTENRDADYDAERWAVEAFTMLTVQPITESLDDDGTGFITTQEANEFASSRPEGWSLLKWLIYWGEEWYASLVDYRIKILRIMQRMYDRLQDLHPGNRDTVDRYLYYSAFRRIELLMRGFNVSRPCANQSLRKHYQEYTNQEEVRLRTSLEECDYDLDDTFTLNMVKGPGRIERCIFPLLYLMLRRHLAIIECGKECDLRWWPLYVASYSLGTLIDAVEERAVTLNALMQNSKADGQTGLTSYAFGMFQNMLDASRCAEDTVEDNLLQFFYDGDDEDDADSNDAVCQDLGLEKFDKDDLEERFETHHRNAWCDVCDTMITGDRYACLQCTNRGLRDRIDLCEQCQDQKPSVESLGLTHKASHTLARISFHLHDKDATRVYNDARRALERVKECMAHRAGSAVTASADGASATASIGFPSICGACNAQISRPFWYCSTCCATRTNKRDRDVLSCYDCGRERRHQHDISHIWILVQDEALLPKLSAVELQLKTLEKRVVDLNSRMANLESKLDDILATQRAA